MSKGVERAAVIKSFEPTAITLGRLVDKEKSFIRLSASRLAQNPQMRELFLGLAEDARKNSQAILAGLEVPVLLLLGEWFRQNSNGKR